MQISELKTEVRNRLVDFAWEQWSQMGVSGAYRRADRSAADPEALLLFTLEVARADARLFDEVLDWLAANERLVSVQRLRNLCRDDTDRSLAEAALAWATQSKRKQQPNPSPARHPQPAALFRQIPADPLRADQTFQSHGWLRSPAHRTGKSQPPNLFAPINFAFRLRAVLGIGARAEVARFLLTVPAPTATAQVITESAGYAKRNVHDALTLFTSAGVIRAVTVGNEQRYNIDRQDWAAFLGLEVDDLPSERSWPRLLYALRRLLRWLEQEDQESRTPYMRASQARTLAAEILPDLRYAGVRVPLGGRTGADYWEEFVALVGAALAAID
jgi:hypothetical protein